MHSILLFVSLFVLAASMEISEDELDMFRNIFCNEDSKGAAEKMKKCFSEMDISENANTILESCCDGMVTPITGDTMQTYVCGQSPENVMQCINCQEEEFKKSGGEEKYEDVTESLKECLVAEFGKSTDEK